MQIDKRPGKKWGEESVAGGKTEGAKEGFYL